jgi:transposase
MIPDSIKQHKPQGCDIHCKNGHYYVYKVKGYYDKETHKPKSKSLGCIGQIYEDVGFVPSKKEACVLELKTKEYGATKTIMEAGTKLFETLRVCFPSEFIRIYVMAVLKLLGNLASKDLDIAYDKSAISLLLPEVHLSKNTISSFLTNLSSQREGMIKFMNSFANWANDGIIFDGTSFVSASKTNPFCEKGYTPGNKGKTQIRLIYAFDRTNHEPVYFKCLPGNISDKTAFESCLDEIGDKPYSIVLDKGFFSDKNVKLMSGMEFIMPLQKNTTLVLPQFKLFSGHERAITNNFLYHNRIVYFTEIYPKKYESCKICIFYDLGRRQYLMENYFRKNMEVDGTLPYEIESTAADDTATFGVTMLLTSMKKTPQNIYLDYKSRWDIEEMFDAHKNTLGFNMSYEVKYATQEGWAFIEFLSLLLFHKLNRMLITCGLAKTLSVKDLLFRAVTITQSNSSGAWKICNMTKPLKEMFQCLGVSMQAIK